MRSAEREALILLIGRVQEIEKEVAENTTTILAVQQALCRLRPEFEELYKESRIVVEQSVAAHLGAGLDDIYAGIIQLLKGIEGSDSPPRNSPVN
jgi:hypothetical protein